MLARHMLGTLLTSDKSTITNLICTHGGQDRDWTADYRLYSRDRVEESHLFDQAREALLENLAPGEALVVALDDTIVRKTGKKIHGSGWKRDPLGPAFQTNLVQAQRYLQFSAAWPLRGMDGAPAGEARMIPIDFLHAPSPVKPKKGTVDPDATAAYREALKQQNLNAQTLSRLQALREKVPVDRRIVLTGDGSFTNKTVVRGLPAGCVYIGRARKDTVLHHLPETPEIPANGRPCRYGSSAPTPEALRTDDTIPWQTVRAFAAGGHHEFRIKTLGPVLWRKAGADLPLRLIVIAPLGYRLRKGSRLLYRQPAYLLCTDPDMSLEEFLQSYLWRWGIEVNFREEKTLIGTGDAHVRTPSSNQHLPAVTVAAYALLWVAALIALAENQPLAFLRPPKWRKDHRETGRLPSTGDLLRLLRAEIWVRALNPGTFDHFTTDPPPDTSAQKPAPDLSATLFAAA
jgi:hypothetical protein